MPVVPGKQKYSMTEILCPVSDSTHHQKALTATSNSFKKQYCSTEEENDFMWKHFGTKPMDD
jgi:hypothetical protein